MDKMIKANSVEEAAAEIVKTKKHRNRPDLANFGADAAEPGDNSRYLRMARVSLSLPPIDISDEKQVAQRITDYFDFCEQNDRKPNIVGMANWLGVSRDTLNSWERGECRGSTHSDLIKRAKGMLEELSVEYLADGKVSPPNGIFLLKALFGYRDVQDIVITPNNPLATDQTADEIAEKYKELPEE